MRNAVSSSTRERWRFLQTLHPLFLFAESLPTIEAADHGHHDSATVDGVGDLTKDIVTLRSGLKLNVIKQRLVDIDQLTEDDPTVEGLELDLQTMLEELERLVSCNVLAFDRLCTSGQDSLACFPKLFALWKLLHGQGRGTAPNYRLYRSIRRRIDSSMWPPCSWGRTYPPRAVALVASFIRFPRDAATIEACERAVSRFGMAMDRVSGDSSGPWAMEADYTPEDIEVIQHARDFASTCASLFSQVVQGTKCGTPHQAKVHLSGFKDDQLKMYLGTCQETHWVPVMFMRSFGQPSPDAFYSDHICSPVSSLREGSEALHVAFNSEGMWASNSGAVPDSPTLFAGEQSLDHFLTLREGLPPKHRKLAVVLLAASMFQLSESPWIEQHLSSECIFVPSPDNKRLEQWCPRVHCTLESKKNSRLQDDGIAAFGVLVLELEAGRRADWTAVDDDCISGERSNQARLARILTSWRDWVGDDYRGVARACLEFDSLTQTLDYPDIISERKDLAVIYKCIPEPLFKHATKNFANLAHLFEGMFAYDRSPTSRMRTIRVLFDDDDSLPKCDDQNTASAFLNGLDPFFRKIKALQSDISLAHPTHERIRIAVLDSGVSETDSMIRRAIRSGQINAQRSKSFVGSPAEWQQDTFGHGTHITRLLLKTARAAEIYVGKICTGKVMNNESMPAIAKAIDWAVNECDAHIISISFGFGDEHELVDASMDKAMETGKVIIAAASNNGGLSGRARPARYRDVICMHATDGKGNKGGMNPSPMASKDNFSTLGVAVPSRWDGNDVWKSGTSYAVPVAVGFAADILEFARHKCTNLNSRKLKILHKGRGMQEVFRQMSKERDGYDFVHPVHLWGGWLDTEAGTEADIRAERRAARFIEDIMEDL